MNVLLVSHTPALGGAERCLLDLARGLKERKVEVIALCPDEGPLTAQLRPLGVRVFIRRMNRPQRSVVLLTEMFATWPWRVWRLSAWMRDQKVTVVYNNTVDALYAPFAAALSGVPCVWHVHEIRPDQPWLRRLLARLIATFATKAVFNSTSTLDAFAEARTNRQDWTVVHNGVVLPDAVQPRSQDADTITAGFAADMRPHKRPDLFLRALAKSREEVPKLRGVIAGDGILLQDMRDLATTLGLSEAVNFRGRVEDIESFYAMIDVLVLTSQREGFGRVLVEAMAAGIPVVASNVGGVPEVVEDGASGYLVSPGDVEAFARRIVELASDDDLRLRMGHAGRQRVAERFTISRYSDEMIDILEAAAASRS